VSQGIEIKTRAFKRSWIRFISLYHVKSPAFANVRRSYVTKRPRISLILQKSITGYVNCLPEEHAHNKTDEKDISLKMQRKTDTVILQRLNLPA
jgi:hypothetical protein